MNIAKLDHIKAVCQRYGADQIVGFVIDTQERFTTYPNEFSYKHNVDEATKTLTKIEYDSNGLPYRVYIPIALVHTIIVKDKNSQLIEYCMANMF